MINEPRNVKPQTSTDKRIYWWLLGGALLLLGWVGYRYVSPTPSALAACVPPDALLVIESRDLHTDGPPSRFVSLRQLPLFDVALSRLQRLFDAAPDSVSLRRFLVSKTVRYSLHPVSKNELDFIFYVPVSPNGTADEAFLQRFQQADPNRFRTLSRQFAGQTIYELRDLGNRIYGSYLIRDNCLIGSPSAILLENVARHLDKSFRPQSGVSFPASADNVASLYVRPDVLSSLIGTSSLTSSLLRVFVPESLTFQFRRSASPSHWLGFASDPVGNRQAVAQLFAGQTPHRLRHGELIPQQTATLYHLSLSDAARFGEAVTHLLESGGTDQLKQRLARIRPLLPAVYQSLAGDVLLCRMEANTAAAGQVLLLQATDVRRLSRAIQQIAFRLGNGTGPVRPRAFLGHQLLPLPVDELPATMLSSLFAGFSQTWITQHNGYVVLANSEETLQTYLLSLNQQTVWTRDPRLTLLITETLRPAHLTTFTRLPRAGSAFLTQWPANWQRLLGPAPFAQIDNLAYQATYSPEHILSTLVLGRSARRSDTTVLNRVLLRKRIPFNASLIASPVIVGRLSDPGAQIWAQNSARQFVLLTTEKDKLVQDTTDGPILSNVLAVDWRANGRLQYLFATNRSLYVADLGNKRVQLQRVALPDGIDPTYLALPKGRNRQPDLVALLPHRDGSIFALDRKGQRLVRLFAAPSASPLLLPFQVVDQDDRLEVVGLQANRRLNRWVMQWGKPVAQAASFPVLIAPTDSSRFAGPGLWLPNPNRFVAITAAGELLTLNDGGQLRSRKQLYRPLRGGVFRLFPDVAQTGYLLLRTTDAEVSVLNETGERLFELRNLNPERTHVQYHRLGAGVEVLAVKSGGYTTLYNRTGERIGDRPIPSDFPVTLQYDEPTNELYIVSSVQKAVQLFSIRIQ